MLSSIIPPAIKQTGAGRPQKNRQEQGSQAVLSQAVGGTVDTEMAVTTADTAQVLASQGAVAATETTVRKEGPKRKSWVYVVDFPCLQEAVSSRTRSGKFLGYATSVRIVL